jgi:D-aminopeptidase
VIRIGELESGPNDAITDVDGVRVGHTTLIEGDDVRTGVTVVVPPHLPLFAAPHRLNGNGELTGLEWVRESGLLTTPIGLTNTHSVGVVRDAIVAAQVEAGQEQWHLPVVGETWDGTLNDINGFHVHADHVHKALRNARGGPVEQGNVGSGTGMICHGYKGGIGTASRRVGEWTVGVLVQANHGRHARLQIDGVPVGRELRAPERKTAGSIIVIVATDAPLLPHQCERVAQRSVMGIARTGGAGENSSGDLILAFSTQEVGETVRLVPNERIDPLFYAVIEATEAAIVNALLAAETMTGRGGVTVPAIEEQALAGVMRRYGR